MSDQEEHIVNETLFEEPVPKAFDALDESAAKAMTVASAVLLVHLLKRETDQLDLVLAEFTDLSCLG